MGLKFIPSNLVPCQIVEVGRNKYLMNNSTTIPKNFILGGLSEEISVEVIELSAKQVDKFRLLGKPKTNIGTATIVLMVQPFVKITSNFMKSIFGYYGFSQQLFLKLATFCFSTWLAYLISRYYYYNMYEKLSNRLVGNEKRYRLVFKTIGKSKRDFSWFLFPSLILVCLAFYLGTKNNTEGVFLIINGIISFGLFLAIFSMPTVSHNYKNKKIVFDRMEEIKTGI